jgi:hypothetical protein
MSEIRCQSAILTQEASRVNRAARFIASA